MSVKDRKTSYNSDDFYNIAAINPSFNKFNLQFTILNRMNSDYSNNVIHLKPEIEIAPNKDIYFDLNLSTRDLNNEDKYRVFMFNGIEIL